MKHFISLLGIVGVISVFYACSGDDAPDPISPDNSAVVTSSSSQEAAPQPASAEKTPDSSAETATPSSSSKGKKESDSSVVMTTQVTIDTGATEFDLPYSSDGVFCWEAGCEKWASSASGPDIPPDDSISLSSDVPNKPNLDAPPVIEGLVMTDMRDSQKYNLRDINGTIWTQNMNISLTGSNCYKGDNNNCKQYGRLYTLSAAQEACPAGWKLPSRADFDAARNLTDFWKYGGRGKDGNEDFMGDMGFYWLDSSEEAQEGDKISDSCNNGSSCAMIFVADAPGYGDEETKFQFDSQAKGFSVRCVQAK
jgi:uncharacterized protein (TIGR02145 family)